MSKLVTWLEATGTKRGEFAKAIGVSPAYVTLLCSESPSWPGRDVAARIRDVTGGVVTADDFLPPAETEGQAA